MSPSLKIGGLGILMVIGSNLDGNEDEMMEEIDDSMSEGEKEEKENWGRRCEGQGGATPQTRSISRGPALKH